MKVELMIIYIVLSRNLDSGETGISGVYSTLEKAEAKEKEINLDSNRSNDSFQGEIYEFILDE